MSNFKKITCTCLSALLIAAAIPNEFFIYGSALFGFFSLLPLYIALYNTKRKLSAGMLCALFLAVSHCLSGFWLAFFEGFAVFTLGGPAFAYIVFGLLIGPVFLYAIKTPAAVRPWIFGILWTLWEWVKSTGFLGYPWGTLPMTLFNVPQFMQIADITGVYGVTFLLASSSAVGAELCIALPQLSAKKTVRLFCTHTAVRNVLFLLGITGMTFIYGTVRLNGQPEPIATVKAAVIQHNADSWSNEPSADSMAIKTAQSLTRLCIANSIPKPELVIWSETILTKSYPNHQNYYNRTPHGDPFIPFVKETGIPMLTGGTIIQHEPFKAFNAALLLNSNAELIDFYGKTQLVPFAENIPFIEYEWMRNFMQSIAGFSASWTPGRIQKVFPVRDTAGSIRYFSTPICFEDAFSWVCRAQTALGSDLFVNITNDSWSKTDSAEIQHMVLALYRTIECRRPMVRACNSGVTCVVDRDGRVIQALPLFTEAAMSATIPIYEPTETFFLRIGKFFPVLLLLFAALFFGMTQKLRTHFETSLKHLER